MIENVNKLYFIKIEIGCASRDWPRSNKRKPQNKNKYWQFMD